MSEKTTNQVAQKPTKSLIDSVTERVTNLQKSGEIKFPTDYAPQNALSNAWLLLSEQVNKDGVAVTESCSKASIASALMKMVVQGLSPIKNQCYFIPYGKTLNFQRSYQGTIALAKRVANVKQVNANLIFEGDDYQTEMNNHGVKTLVKHDSPFANRDDNKIIGAYAVVVFNDGSCKLEEMTIQEIKRSWAQGATKGNSPAHTNFKGEMCKKTVINRALKTEVNSSSDSDLFDDDEDKEFKQYPDIPKSANSETLTFDEHVEVVDDPKAIETKPEVKMPEKEKDKVLQNAGNNGGLFEGQGKDMEAGF